MDDRLPAHLEAAALRRAAEAAGGQGTVLHRGDPDRGAILLLVAQRGRHIAGLERSLGADGYRWRTTGPTAESPASELAKFVAKRRDFDPDCWIVELDIADPERFIAEKLGSG